MTECKWCKGLYERTPDTPRYARKNAHYCCQDCKNQDIDWRRDPHPCLGCGQMTLEFDFCNLECRQGYVRMVKRKKWIEGTYDAGPILPWMKEYLKARWGSKCSQCGWDEYHNDGKSLTQIDHINGDSKDSRITNLRILCPNCHSLTPTFGSRNKKSFKAKRERNVSS